MKKNLLLLFLMVSLFSITTLAQVTKVPADTRQYLQTIEARNQEACARSMSKAVKQREAKLFVSCATEADAKVIETQLKAIGAHPQGTIGRYIMVSTPVGLVNRIADIENVTFISKSPSVNMKTVISKEVTGVSKIHAGSDNLPQAYTGKNVVVGVIDIGFDFTHPSFKDAEGNLRIKSLYAPNMKHAEGKEKVTTTDGKELGGVAFNTPEEILAIGTDNENGSHGSHCASIAAGSTFDWAGGMAPEADIVLCSLGLTKLNNEADSDEAGDTNLINELGYAIMHCILYIRDYAHRAGKPYIVSMSMNSHDGPHDGTSLISSIMNELALKSTNMVLASSNEGANICYVNHTFTDKDTLHTITLNNIRAYAYTRMPGDITFQIGIFDAKTREETWRSAPLSSTNNGCSLQIMFDQEIADNPVFEDIRSHLSQVMNGGITINLGHLEDGRANLKIQTTGNASSAITVFHITSSENTTVDLWGDGSTGFSGSSVSDYYTDGINDVSMGDWCTGGNIITVGSWIAKSSFVNINGETTQDIFEERNKGVGYYSPFSSYGVDIAGHSHPYVSTPGSMIIAAANHFDSAYDPASSGDVVAKDSNGFAWAAMSGTSMATPTAAGIIALWLEAKPTLTYQEIRETIAATSTTDEYTEEDPIHYGCGKMNAYKGLLHVLGIPTNIPELSQHQPKDITFRMKGGQLFINGAEDGTPIRIYTTDGRLVASTHLLNGSVSLPAGSPAGVYAVQIGTLGSTLVRK